MRNPSEVAYLVEQARKQPAAFAEIYHLYVRRVYRYIYHQVGNVHDAEDLTAQVFMAAWESLPCYQEMGLFAAWLFGIARNKVSTFYRGRRAEIPLDGFRHQPSDSLDPPSHWQQIQDLRHLSRLLEELDPEEREMLRLRFAADLSYREIGIILNKSEAATKMKMKRLLQTLQIEWETTDEGKPAG